MGTRPLFALASGLAVCAAALAAAPSEFAAMDTNGDGRISIREHVRAAERMFRIMDADGDGRVTAEEMTAAQEKITGRKPGPQELSAAEKIKAVDVDGDGVLTAAEHAAAARALFLTMDRNKDGSLSQAEFDSGHRALKKK
jgi:Ca2+-binding EF-hand superfamily protein